MSSLNTEIYSTSDATETRQALQKELDKLLLEQRTRRHYPSYSDDEQVEKRADANYPTYYAYNKTNARGDDGGRDVTAIVTDNKQGEEEEACQDQETSNANKTSAPPTITVVTHTTHEKEMSQAASHIRVHVERIATKRQLALEEEALEYVLRQRRKQIQDQDEQRGFLGKEEAAREALSDSEKRNWSKIVEDACSARKRATQQIRMRLFAQNQAQERAAAETDDQSTQRELDAMLFGEEYTATYKGSSRSAKLQFEKSERFQFWEDVRRKRTSFPLWEKDLLGAGGTSRESTNKQANIVDDGRLGQLPSSSQPPPYETTSPYESRLTEAFFVSRPVE